MNKTSTFLSAAGFLLLSIGCGSSEPSDTDASIVLDAQLESSGATATGGKASTGGTGGSGGVGGADGGGSPATGGVIGSGGAIGTGGKTTGTGGASIDAGTGGAGIDAGTGGARIDARGGDAGIDGSADQVCGGIAALQCPKGQFCEYSAGECSGIADATGLCAMPTQVCTAIYQPVCGCDGKTYGNDCERRGAGVSKRADGDCTTIGKMCGGIAGFACSKEQFCDLTPGDCGRIADGAGTCTVTGAGVACDKVYKPVCGCDGKTYGNDCERQVAGVSKVSDGACPIVDGGTTG